MLLKGVNASGELELVKVVEGIVQVEGTIEVDTNTDELEAILAKLSSDPATQTTLAAILAAMGNDPATQTTLAAILAKLIEAPATEAKQTALAVLIGALDATAVVDPTADGSQIALLKGLIKQLQGDGTAGKAAPVTLLGSITTMTHTPITAAATTTAALAANANRKYALLVNDSDEVIYIKLGAEAVLNQGIRLNASGGSYEMSNSIGNLTTGAINCISTSGGKILLATEGV